MYISQFNNRRLPKKETSIGNVSHISFEKFSKIAIP